MNGDVQMKLLHYLFLLFLAISVITGCAPGVTYLIDVAYVPRISQQPAAQSEQLRVAVIPFEDARENKKGIAVRRRLTGQTDEFETRPYPASAAVTDTLLSALKIHGYQPVTAPKGRELGTVADDTSGQLVLSGRIEELWADIVTESGLTNIKTRVSLRVSIFNASDKSARTVTVQAESEPRVVLFSPGLLQNAVNDTLTEAINKLLSSLK